VREIVAAFKPDAVIGVGGYSSFPVLKHAQHKGIPTFIHESNSFAGKTNMMVGKNATKVFVASDGMEKFFPGERIMITGNPVRKAIVEEQISREEAIALFGLDPAKTTILAVGGSLGARSINEALAAQLDAFQNNDLQLIWQTGKTNAEKYVQLAKNNKNIFINDFITQMEKGYAAADIVISRAGAMAVTELCVTKKPVVFVPYPFAAEDHQTVNAKHLVDKNAALMIKDDEANEKLVSTIIQLAKNERQQQELKQNIGKLAITNADEIIAKEILNSIRA
jgi:UDP-N-acetylglucosamine--N-acetylmuramyl-(pentapeptide) pyrophosphoryl-undecaprenol N-acetylglucosamine transferase